MENWGTKKSRATNLVARTGTPLYKIHCAEEIRKIKSLMSYHGISVAELAKEMRLKMTRLESYINLKCIPQEVTIHRIYSALEYFIDNIEKIREKNKQDLEKLKEKLKDKIEAKKHRKRKAAYKRRRKVLYPEISAKAYPQGQTPKKKKKKISVLEQLDRELELLEQSNQQLESDL